MEGYAPFHEQLRYERERRGWNQADLAEKVGCDAKTVGRWESGETFPRSYHRQALCKLFGKSAEELGLVKVRIHTSSSPSITVPQEDRVPASPVVAMDPSMIAGARRVLLSEDWDDAPQPVELYGRERECRELARWLRDRHCRVVALVGMGGMGKTVLATTVAARVKEGFASICWRSLHNAPPLELILKHCLRVVADQQPVELPEDVDEQIALLLHFLRSRRCLLVLDNLEAILQAGRSAGRYRAGYEGYGELIKRIAETQHQSCLLLTSREKPTEVAQLEGKTSPVRTWRLAGIVESAGQTLLKDRELFGSDEAWRALVHRYSGNPLALQLAAEAIEEVFDGDIARFLQEEASVFGDITDVLDQQFRRLSSEEREIMDWLAIEREAVPLEELREDLVQPMAAGKVLEILDSLRRRSLIETRGPAHFTLQPVILDYVTTGLVERACREFAGETTGVWTSHALIKAKSKDYVRESQVRLLLDPVAQRLLARLGKQGIEQAASSMLSVQRREHGEQPLYLAGNLLNLLGYLHCDLRDFDCSHLVVRQAYLQHVSLPRVNFAHAQFMATIFTSTFGNVLAVACSPSGKLFAVGTAAGDIWIYRVERGTLLLICQGHSDGVWSLAFSPDGRLLASGSDDHTIRLWDIDTGSCIGVLRDHTNRVRAIAFSPRGKMLASGSDDQTVRLWDASNWRCLKTLPGHTGRVWSVAFSPRGKMLASGSTDQTIRLWDSGTGTCLTILEGHSGWIRSVAFHPEGTLLASGGDDRAVRVWDVKSSECLKVLPGHSSRVWSVAFAPDGQSIASGSEDQSIRLWDVESGHCLRTLPGHTYGVRCVAFSPDGHTLFSGGDDQSCRLWDASTGYCLKTLQGYTNRMWSLAFSPDGSMLASVSEDQAIRLWNVEQGRCLRVVEDDARGDLALAFSPDGSLLASGGQGQVIRLRDADSGRSLKTLQGHTNWVRSIAFSPAGGLLASGGEDQVIRLWDASSAHNSRVLEGHGSWVRSVAFSPAGDLLASGSDDQSVRLWDVMSGECLRTLQGHTSRVRSVDFSPDGRILASGSEDQTIRLWEVSSGECVSVLQGHSGWVRSVAFCSDGSVLASGSEDQTIRLWDVKSGQCMSILRGHRSRVRCVTFSPHGSVLASSSDDGMIKLWDVQSAACLKTLAGERPYERMNISGAQGLAEAQKVSLLALGAIEDDQK